MDSWRLTTPYPTTINHASAVGINGMLYVIGGQTNAGTPTEESRYVSAVYAYDPKTEKWLPRAPMPTARADFEEAFYAPPGHHPEQPTLCTAPLVVARRRVRRVHGLGGRERGVRRGRLKRRRAAQRGGPLPAYRFASLVTSDLRPSSTACRPETPAQSSP